MKGKIFKNQFGKLSLRGEDGEFYYIGKSLSQYGEGDSIEFDVTETTYNDKLQKWANAPKADKKETKESKEDRAENTNEQIGASSDAMNLIIRGISAIVLEQRKTNDLLEKLLKREKSETVAPSSMQSNIGPLPF